MTRSLVDCVRHTNLDLAHHRAFWAAVESKLPAGSLDRGGELGSIWESAVAAKPSNDVLLKVPYEFQNDNASGTGYRECFSSSCAMVARFYNKVGSDDEYNRIRARFGDSTDTGAQLRALGHLGLSAAFTQRGDAATLERVLRNGRPIPVGWLHKGPVSKPSGGGHWSVVIGITATTFIHHDPNGEADLVNGGYRSTARSAGQQVAYSRMNWLKRWEADGRGSGWMLDIRP